MKHRTPYIYIMCMVMGMTACQNTNISQMASNVTEQMVDSMGHVSRTERTLPYTEVVINCFADATYHQQSSGSECSLQISASEEFLNHMKINVSDNGILMLNLERGYNPKKNEMAVVHLYAPTVNKFVVNGGKRLRLGNLTAKTPVEVVLNGVGDIHCDALNAPEVVALLNGVGNVNLSGIDTHRLRAKMNGVGDIVLAGNAEIQQIASTGVGHIDTGNLNKGRTDTDQPSQENIDTDKPNQEDEHLPHITL